MPEREILIIWIVNNIRFLFDLPDEIVDLQTKKLEVWSDNDEIELTTNGITELFNK